MSQHSAQKLAKYYPQLALSILEKFYGRASNRKEKELWSKLVITKLTKYSDHVWPGTENINMTEFFERTSPHYYIYSCQFEHIDCRRMWRKVTTINGVCLEFNPLEAMNQYKKTLSQMQVKDNAFEFE